MDRLDGTGELLQVSAPARGADCPVLGEDRQDKEKNHVSW